MFGQARFTPARFAEYQFLALLKPLTSGRQSRRLGWTYKPPQSSEAQSWRKRNMTHQCSHERAPASAHLSAPKSRDSLRLRRRFSPLPRRIARFLRPQDARFPLRRKSLANRRFSLRLKGTNLIPTAEFPAIPESAAKIASEQRCAILVHSGAHASAHASVHESPHKSWLSLYYSPTQGLPLECSRECSRGCPRKCTRSGLVVCHLVCFHLLCSLQPHSQKFNFELSLLSLGFPQRRPLCPLHIRHRLQTPIVTRKEGSFSYQMTEALFVPHFLVGAPR